MFRTESEGNFKQAHSELFLEKMVCTAGDGDGGGRDEGSPLHAVTVTSTIENGSLKTQSKLRRFVHPRPKHGNTHNSSNV